MDDRARSRSLNKMNEYNDARGFGEHHQRHVRTTFQYIDKLLSEAEHTMADAGSPSPFRMHSDDTTPIQRKVTHDYIMRIREAMRRVMYEAIVMKARDEHLAGATVLRGPMGFGAASRIHTAKILRLSMNLPIVIEIVDSEEKPNEFLPDLERMIGGGLVTWKKSK